MSSPKLSLGEKRSLILSYYAGFSEAFVRHCLDNVVPSASSVLDPWNGSGTTTFVCAKKGIEAWGNDLSPVANVIATARSASIGALPNLACMNISINEKILGRSRYIRLIDGLYLLGERWLDQTDDSFHLRPQNAIILATLFRMIRRYTTRIELNNPTWIPQNSLASLALRRSFIASLFVRELRVVLDSVRQNSIKQRPTITQGLAQDIQSVTTKKFDTIITSPPYLTRLDYVRTVQAETEFLGRFIHFDTETLRRSMMGSVLTNNMSDGCLDLSQRARAILAAIKNHKSKASSSYYFNFFAKYFFDLSDSLKAMMGCSDAKAKWVVVVQSSFYKEIYIDLAAIISEMASNVGMIAMSRVDFPQRRSIVHLNTRATGYQENFTLTESAVILSAA